LDVVTFGRSPCRRAANIWSKHAREECVGYLLRTVKGPEDAEAQARMLLAAAAAAGTGFGNAGVDLCHAMSYLSSGKIRATSA